MVADFLGTRIGGILEIFKIYIGEILKKYIDTIVILSLSKANGNEFKFQVLKHRFKKSLKSFMLLNQCNVALELERG